MAGAGLCPLRGPGRVASALTLGGEAAGSSSVPVRLWEGPAAVCAEDSWHVVSSARLCPQLQCGLGSYLTSRTLQSFRLETVRREQSSPRLWAG